MFSEILLPNHLYAMYSKMASNRLLTRPVEWLVNVNSSKTELLSFNQPRESSLTSVTLTDDNAQENILHWKPLDVTVISVLTVSSSTRM